MTRTGVEAGADECRTLIRCPVTGVWTCMDLYGLTKSGKSGARCAPLCPQRVQYKFYSVLARSYADFDDRSTELRKLSF